MCGTLFAALDLGRSSAKKSLNFRIRYLSLHTLYYYLVANREIMLKYTRSSRTIDKDVEVKISQLRSISLLSGSVPSDERLSVCVCFCASEMSEVCQER